MPPVAPRADRLPAALRGTLQQASYLRSERKNNVGFVCHFLLLHDNYAGIEAFPRWRPRSAP